MLYSPDQIDRCRFPDSCRAAFFSKHEKASALNTQPFDEALSQGLQVTSYDLEHLTAYLRLLDLEADGTLSWKEAVRQVFDVDPDKEPRRARALYDSHLERARWMTRFGYRQIAAFERFDSHSG